MYNQYIVPEGSQGAEEAALPSESASKMADGAVGIAQALNGLLGKVLPSSGREKGEGLFSGIPFLEKLDGGDILLILILIYLFRESEDEEWLIILALVLLMGL